MLSLWVQDAAGREQARAALPADTEVRASGAWEAFRTSLADATCGVVMAGRPSDAELFAELRLLREIEAEDVGRDVPLVLCLPRSSAVIRRLKDVIVEEVVWLDEMEEELAPAVLRAEAERRFRGYRRRVEGAEELSPTLSRALGRALTRHPPVTTVQRLAEEVDRDRRTLWHHWHQTIAGDDGLTLKGFLDWVVLLRAGVERTATGNWGRVAEEFDLHTRTLRRTARRRTDAPLGRLDDGGLEACFRRFEEEVLPRITGPVAEDQTPRA